MEKITSFFTAIGITIIIFISILIVTIIGTFIVPVIMFAGVVGVIYLIIEDEKNKNS